MPYIRNDINCDPKNPQPGHYDVSQQESCLAYENFNADYVRTDSKCAATTQPDILNGWNNDYIRVLVDGTKITGLGQQQVEQTIYEPKDKDNNDLPFVCYNRPLLNPITFNVNRIIDTTNIFIAREDGADYFFENEGGDRFLLQVEPNTYVNPAFLTSN